MLGFSGEHLLIFVIVLFVFGPSRIPQMGSVLGKTVRNFKDSWKGIHEPEYRKLSEKDDTDDVR